METSIYKTHRKSAADSTCQTQLKAYKNSDPLGIKKEMIKKNEKCFNKTVKKQGEMSAFTTNRKTDNLQIMTDLLSET